MADSLITNLPNVPSPTGAEELPVNVPGTPDTDGKVVFSALAAYVKGTIGNATASVAGLATAAQITKLDGIEALADVTDAGNVGSAIHGATAKTTPVDADTVPLIDSAASNVLKKLSWANIKATLKTYLDPFYLLKSVYDPQNAGKISGADGVDEELYGGASGGTGGTLSMDGGNTSTFMETAFGGGSAGSINTSGGSADGATSGGTGGSINTSGSPGVSGGDINTTAGGSITTGVGNVNFGNTSGTLQPHALSTTAFDDLAPTTTKGDLIVHNGTDNIRVAVGVTNGHVLTVDSAEASGVKWAASGGGGGKVAQVIITETASTASTTTIIPYDATIPQITEGASVGIDTSITPTNASSTLIIDVELFVGAGTIAIAAMGALFVDSTADALAVGAITLDGQYVGVLRFSYSATAGSTSARTYRARYGPSAANLCYLNRAHPQSALFGGTLKCRMTITEILP